MLSESIEACDVDMFFSVLTSVTFVIELAGVISPGPSGTPSYEDLQKLRTRI